METPTPPEPLTEEEVLGRWLGVSADRIEDIHFDQPTTSLDGRRTVATVVVQLAAPASD